MLTVYNCLVAEHDLRLVGLAAVICALASFTAISLLHHVRKSTTTGTRRLWLAVSATSTGFGIWATHFIAMLAFAPGIPTAYNITLTGLSLVAAIFLTGIGLAVAVKSMPGQSPWIGGAVAGGAMVGGGIAAMHYTGMAAFEVMGRVVWDPVLVTASILLGVLIGAVALPAGLRRDSLKWKCLGAVLLTLAICSLHFTAMGAAAVVPDPTVQLSETSLPAGLLAIAVALASFVIVVLALGGVALEVREQRRQELEADRMRGLANAAVEGLLVCDGETIVTVNDKFAELVGAPSADSAVGSKLEQYLPDDDVRAKLFERENQLVETVLHNADGSEIAVEVIQRIVDLGGKPHRAIAVRDLRARKEAERNILFLAHHDALTGLANRSSLQQEGRSGDRSGANIGAAACRHVPRSRSFQGGQRPVRTCRRRSRTTGGRQAHHRRAR